MLLTKLKPLVFLIVPLVAIGAGVFPFQILGDLKAASRDPEHRRSTWVGKTILIKKPDTAISKIDDRGKRVHIEILDQIAYTVLAEQTDLLKVRTPYGNEGWLDKDDAALFEEAVIFFTDSIRQNPNIIWDYICRVVAFMHLEKLDKALEDCNEAIRLDPNEPRCYLARGQVWSMLKEYHKAIADFDEANRLDPQSSWPFHNRGCVRGIKKEYDEAISDFNEAIRLNPQCAWPINNRGDA